MVEGARQTYMTDGKIGLSIVGGAQGLYGDFKDDFEIAIMDSETGDFVTKYYLPEANDDVVGYLSSEALTSLANTLFPKGFQVR